MNRCPHNDEYECFDCETARHDAEHPTDVDGCRTCKYRTIQISPAATPTKTRSKAAPKRFGNPWEKGVATDHRGVPYRDEKLEPISVKRFENNRSTYEAQLRQYANKE